MLASCALPWTRSSRSGQSTAALRAPAPIVRPVGTPRQRQPPRLLRYVPRAFALSSSSLSGGAARRSVRREDLTDADPPWQDKSSALFLRRDCHPADLPRVGRYPRPALFRLCASAPGRVKDLCPTGQSAHAERPHPRASLRYAALRPGMRSTAPRRKSSLAGKTSSSSQDTAALRAPTP